MLAAAPRGGDYLIVDIYSVALTNYIIRGGCVPKE